MTFEIKVISILEAIRKRPELHVRNINTLLESLIDEAKRQDGIHAAIDISKVGFELLIKNYKYDVIRPYKPGKGDNYLTADLTSTYTGAGPINNRCLMGLGPVINAVSKIFHISAWDGDKYYTAEYKNGIESGILISDSGYNGLIAKSIIRDDFLYLLGDGTHV